MPTAPPCIAPDCRAALARLVAIDREIDRLLRERAEAAAELERVSRGRQEEQSLTETRS